MAIESSKSLTLLEQWLETRLAGEGKAWFNDRLDQLESDRDFYLAIALVPRKLGKADLILSDAECAACDGWSPLNWTVDQAARITLLLSGPEEAFVSRLEKLCATGDVGELVTLYQALPLYPNPESLTKRAAEGLRSNVVPVFEAVAHGNPFPERYFDEAAWNQMVLKALFIGSSLHPIQGLEARSNEPLAATLIDYAHERWAAGREVNPELWRCVGPFLDEARMEDVKRAWESEDPLSRAAAALSLASSKLPAAQTLLASRPSDAPALSWEDIHRALTSC